MSVSEPQDWAFHFFENQADLLKHLIKMVGDADIAHDLVHDTYIKVSQRNQLSLIANPRAYLFTIAANLARDFLRKRNLRSEVGEVESGLENLPAHTVSDERRLYDRQRLAMVEDAIQQLPPKCREAFVFRKIEGLNTAEIAVEMGVSRNMVEKHLRKALSLTREHLRKRDH